MISLEHLKDAFCDIQKIKHKGSCKFSTDEGDESFYAPNDALQHPNSSLKNRNMEKIMHKMNIKKCSTRDNDAFEDIFLCKSKINIYIANNSKVSRGLQRRQPNFEPHSVHQEFNRIANKSFKFLDTVVSRVSSKGNRLDSLNDSYDFS